MPKESVSFTLRNVDGKHDVKEIKKALDSLPGVLSVSVNDVTGSVAVDYNTTGTQRTRIQKQLEKSGYEIHHIR